MSENTTLKYVHQDHLTGTSLMTSANGTLLGTIKYMPFGETRSGSAPTDKRFTGQRLDDTGLYYYGARYYDPTIGRFISADTIIPNPANPQSLNRYIYCLNNPLKYIDPSGHDTTSLDFSLTINFSIFHLECGFSRISDNHGNERVRVGNFSAGIGDDISKKVTVNATVGITNTNAYDIDEVIDSEESRIGGELYDILGGGYEVILGRSKSGEKYTGSSTKIGLGFGGGIEVGKEIVNKRWTLPWEKSPVSTAPPKPASPPQLTNSGTPATLGEGGTPYGPGTPTPLGDTGFTDWGTTPEGVHVISMNDPSTYNPWDWL